MYKIIVFTAAVAAAAAFVITQTDKTPSVSQAGETPNIVKPSNHQEVVSEEFFSFDNPTPNNPASNSVSEQQGRIAYISPETGELTSKPPETADPINQSEATSAEQALPPIKITTYADGMVKADLNGHFQMEQSATLDCQNNIDISHDHPRNTDNIPAECNK